MEVITAEAVVVGTGAAGYNAACRIRQLGKKSVVMVTEGVNDGTSRNTGSDKQTYYKLTLGGETQDSVRLMAENLFAGGSVDGDNALCEAALSARCFMNLCELGVPFPCNVYGEYVGYKTDHDPYARATSAGPLTSKFMTEALEKQADMLGIPVYDGLMAVEILTDGGKVIGLVCIRKENGAPVLFRCGNIILATGGPAGIYQDSVYPLSQFGSSSLALLAGAQLQNMTEWQYGLASVHPRWNVSGTYMQVLPRFVSVDEKGVEREFLQDAFQSPYEALSRVFLKGYQWPFDSRKAHQGSSLIDLWVYREAVQLKRRIFLDYRKNPFGLDAIDFARLAPEAYDYLKKAGACFGTPIERLRHMNAPAIALYAGKGVDLNTEMLEIALCAQHNNGGIAVDGWWQTHVKGLFAAGECAGTHGVSRPGGSALNAGQVGSLRAAQYISHKGQPLPDEALFMEKAQAALERHAELKQVLLSHPACAEKEIAHARRRMSDDGGAIRNPERIEKLLGETKEKWRNLPEKLGVASEKEMYLAYRLKDILLTQMACLTAMLDFHRKWGKTRGSALYTDAGGQIPDGMPEEFRFLSETGETREWIQMIGYAEGKWECNWRKVRPLPHADDFFENVWRSYRENGNITEL